MINTPKSDFGRNIRLNQLFKYGGTVRMTFEIDPKEIEKRIKKLINFKK